MGELMLVCDQELTQSRSIRISTEAQHGMIAQVVKNSLFNVDLSAPPDIAAPPSS